MRHRRQTIFLPFVLLLLSSTLAAQQPAADRFTILLSNDDGYDAPGLRALTVTLAWDMETSWIAD